MFRHKCWTSERWMSAFTKKVNLMKLIIILSLQLWSGSARHVINNEFLSPDDLVAAAAEPRPVIVELQPEVLPLIASSNSYHDDSTFSDASEKVEKILQRPLSFSYKDQAPLASSEEERDAEVVEVDLQPDAVDYYKHIKNVESAENDETEGSDNEKLEKQKDQVSSEVEDHEEIKDGVVEDSDLQQSHVHSNHKKAAGGSSGGNGHKEKGGGEEHHSSHKGEKGEKGDKGYKGHHYDEKGEKGHHTKEGHEKEYEEKGGHKKNHKHDDGYKAEHHKGEKGQKNSKFYEDGKHSKGHSTKGEHSIHKKDEYEKKQEFYDESHEEDGFEKDGEYSHESDYKKGGHEKGGFHKGGEEAAHHGKKHHYDKGGHFKEGKGHKDSKGHDAHYDHEHKHGEKESTSGGKKWSYKKGDGGGGGGGGGGGKGGGGKYQQADASNVPVHVIKLHNEENVPELILEENENHFKVPNVVYPPLTYPLSQQQFKAVEKPRGQRRFDNDEIILPSIKHKKISQEKVVIQRRNDEIEDDKESFEQQDYPVYKSIINKNQLIDEGYETDKDLNINPKKYKSKNLEDFEEYEDLLLDDTAKGEDELGAYSIYTLGKYTTSTILPVVEPIIESELDKTQLDNSPSPELDNSSPELDNSSSSQLDNSSSPELDNSSSPELDNSSSTELDNASSPELDNSYSPELDNSSLSELDKSDEKELYVSTQITTLVPELNEASTHLPYILEDSVTIPPTVESEGYEKPKYVKISSGNEDLDDVKHSPLIADSSNESIEKLTFTGIKSIPLKGNEDSLSKTKKKKRYNEKKCSISTTMSPIVVEELSSEEIEI